MTASITSAGTLRSLPSEAGLRPHYVGIFWSAAAGAPAWLAALREAAQGTGGLEVALGLPGFLVLADPGDRRGKICADPAHGMIWIGEAFTRLPGTSGSGQTDPADFVTASDEEILSGAWGPFVGIRRGSDGVTIWRDPGGAATAYLAEADGTLLVSDAMPCWLRDACGLRFRVDRRRLAAALAMPLTLTHELPLTGVTLLPAGCAIDWNASGLGPARPVFTLGLAQSREPVAGLEAARQGLRAVVADTCETLARGHDAVALELSGGLDSAILLGALASAGRARDLTCVHFAVAHSGGDERDHARAASDHWGVRLVEVVAEAHEFRFEDVLQSEQPLEPILYGLDPLVERATAGAARAFDASLILTGQGGDSVFLNSANLLPAVDAVRERGWRALLSEVPYENALRARCSLWQVYRAILRDQVTRPLEQAPLLPGAHLGPAATGVGLAGNRHPLLVGAPPMLPGRRAQFEAILNCQHFNSPTLRGVVAPLVHPLLARPVVEQCLSIPTWQLAHGTINRALAREAFSDWLPRSLRRRRSKGDASNYYRRAVAENADFLRAFLLGGTLVAHRFLDGAAIAAALEPDSLIWSEDARLIATYAAFEAWARYWGLG